MHVAGSSIILMFEDEGKCEKILASGALDEWLENVGIWIPNMPIPNHRTWLSVSDWRNHIDEELDLRVGDQCFPIRVIEIEETIGPKCDCCCELVEESQSSEKRDGGDDEEERRSDSVMKVVDNGTFSKETVVSNLIMLKTVNSLEVDRMWEGNKMVDWCVIESDSGMAEENIGLVQCDEEVQCNAVDLSAECGVQNSVQQATIEETDVCSPTDHGPRCRAKIVEVIDFGGQQRKDAVDVVELRGLGSTTRWRSIQNLLRWQRCGDTSDHHTTEYCLVCGRFDRLVVINLPREQSDHSSIVLMSDACDSGPKLFWFFNVWLFNPQHVRELECTWQGLRQEWG
ncbi:hypothetical protein V6N12_007681 [Hibiscus sabdariffa]|uniref:DUF4283 domain-containing protein n=1 Tax=Hibiscus sabdariffa TaxID=183260 RepID=A0ABR2F2H4_9ROSI